MVVASCDHSNFKKDGVDRHGVQRYKCRVCGKRWSEPQQKTLGNMRIGLPLAEMIIKCLCEGVSVRGTARLTNTDPHTVIELLKLVGKACERYMRRNIKGVQVEDIQADEIWQFVYCKQATAKREKYVGGCGDSYCYTAIERNTKLMVAWHFGRRNEPETNEFCWKLAQATKGQFQLSTDGWRK